MAKKYLTTSPRFLAGVYYDASPELPAIIELPEGVKPDSQLIPCDASGKPIGYEKPKPAYNDRKSGAGTTGAEHFGKPLDKTAVDKTAVKESKAATDKSTDDSVI